MGVEEQGSAGGTSVSALARSALGELSTAERKVARALLAAYPAAGLETAAELARRAGVSAPTVVRFVARLGFAGYPAFQKALIREIHAGMGSPAEQYAQGLDVPAGENLLPFVSSTFVEMIDASFRDLPTSEFVAAVELLCNPRMRVQVLGGRFSRLLGDYLAAHLQLLRPRVLAVSGDEFARLALAADATRDDVLVALDFRRYDVGNVGLAQAMSRAGAKVVLLTDRWMSPIAEFADVVLPSRVESPSPFDSLVPALAVVESLVTAATQLLGDDGRARVERLEHERPAITPTQDL